MVVLPLVSSTNAMKTVLTFLFFIPVLAFGQRSFVSLGVDLGIPNTQLKSTAKNGVGLSARYEHPFGNKLAVMGTIGNMSFGKKSFTQKTNPPTTLISKVNMFQIQTGLKYYLTSTSKDQKGVYVFGELGIHIVTIYATVNKSQGSAQDADFSYAPGIGYRVRNLELSYRQQYVKISHGESVNYSGFRLAYVLKKKEEPKMNPY
jgi:hypothetical protein